MDISPQSAFDWRRGVWRRAGGGDAAAEIAITSDWAPIRNFGPIMAADPEAIYGDVLALLRRCDLRITNLECPLTDAQAPVWKSGAVLKGEARHIGALAAVPFEVVTLANNHVFDHGVAAFAETLDLLEANRIAGLGAGMTARKAHEPLVLDVNGIVLGLVNFSEGEDLTAAGSDTPGVFGWDVARAADSVAELKARGVGAVVVICHCGVEYIPFPPPYVAAAFQRIADAGADLVIGHHPHVPQGIQIYNDVPICYSLGNFVFYQETDLYFRKTGYLVKAGLGRRGLTHIAVVPYEIRADRLALLGGASLDSLLHSLEAVSAPLSDPAGIAAAWHGFLCRYGLAGFQQEVATLMEELRREPRKGAAMFRNRIATMQHNQHWIDAMTRIVDGTIGDAPGWAVAMADEYFTRKRTP